MSYDIFSPIAPKMPKLGKGTHTLTLALSQTSAEMREPIAAMIIPVMASLITGVKFKYSDNNFYETCGQMGHLIGPSGIGKAQFTRLVEAVMRSFRQHDETEFQKLVDWQRQMKTKGANKEKPERPDVAFWYPPADMTNAAFLQNSMALEKLGGRTQFVNLPEVEMADRMFGGHRQVSQMVRNIYDQQRAGALRATAEGVTGNPVLRVNITFTSTPEVARQFYKKDLTNGFFGRIPFAYKERGERCGRIPRQGSYGDDFLTKLDARLLRLTNCKGSFTIKPLNKLADQLAEDMAKLGDMTDDDMLWDLSHRSVFSAWKKGAVLWILNDQTWTKSIGEMVEWFCYYDLWSKVKVFGDMFGQGGIPTEQERQGGVKNMLEDLPETFSEQQLEALRMSVGKGKEGTKRQLRVWKTRNFVTYSAQTGLYNKTEEYLTGMPASRKTASHARPTDPPAAPRPAHRAGGGAGGAPRRAPQEPLPLPRRPSPEPDVPRAQQHLPLLLLRGAGRPDRPRDAAAGDVLPRGLPMAGRRREDRPAAPLAPAAQGRSLQTLRRGPLRPLLRAPVAQRPRPPVSLPGATAGPKGRRLVPPHLVDRSPRHPLAADALLRHQHAARGTAEPQPRLQEKRARGGSDDLSGDLGNGLSDRKSDGRSADL